MIFISEQESNAFLRNVRNLISDLINNNKLVEVDLLNLFACTLSNYSRQRYLNNRENILKLLERISEQLVTSKFEDATYKRTLFNTIKTQVIEPFNELFSRGSDIFNQIKLDLVNLIFSFTNTIIRENILKEIPKNDRDAKLVSFLQNLISISVKDESFNKIPLSQSEYLKNVIFVNRYSNPGDFFFSKDQRIEFTNLNMATLNYLGSHILSRNYNLNEIQVQIDYKLTNTPINRLIHPSLTRTRPHTFHFWEIGDELMQIGLGYWYPYFTTKNNARYDYLIDVNFIISPIIIDFLNNFQTPIEDIELFKEKLETFDNTSQNTIINQKYEVSHEQISEYIARHEHCFGEEWSLVQTEYNAQKYGRIDVLLKSQNDDYLVIEVKKDIADYNPIGQILNYINWVKNTLIPEENIGRKVKGIIICREIHNRLDSAFKEANKQELQVWRYIKLEEGFRFEKALEIEGVICPFCGSHCSPRAEQCPHCGDPLE